MKISLTLPGGNSVDNPTDFKPQFTDISSIISELLNIAFYIAAFLAFYWLVWAAFQYILASGNKESLAKARERIKWALIGLAVIFASFSLAQLGGEIFKGVLKGGLPF